MSSIIKPEPILIADVKEAIEFNRHVEWFRGRDPFKVFMLGNCGAHHRILEEAFPGQLTALEGHIGNWPNAFYHIISGSRNQREERFDCFDVRGHLSESDFKCKNFARFSGPMPSSLCHGYDETWDGRFDEHRRMENNRKLMRMFILGKKNGVKVDIEKELFNLGDHLI
jgi:hypothetical protein